MLNKPCLGKETEAVTALALVETRATNPAPTPVSSALSALSAEAIRAEERQRAAEITTLCQRHGLGIDFGADPLRAVSRSMPPGRRSSTGWWNRTRPPAAARSSCASARRQHQRLRLRDGDRGVAIATPRTASRGRTAASSAA